MTYTAQELMEKIIELRIQLDYQIVDSPLSQTEDNIQYHAKELITTFETLKYDFPNEYLQFIEFNPKYKPLEIISEDNSKGFEQIISCINQDKEKTVSSIIKQVQTHEFHQWVRKNSTTAIANASETEADQAIYIHMSQFNLPQVKQEEIGDCIALAFTGILSENHEIFEDSSVGEIQKQSLLRKLMVDNRKYVNWDFKSLMIEDQTEQYAQRKTLYRPRGIAAKKMLDSSYTDGKNLYAVVSTNNTDTASQGAQAFEVYHTLQNNYEHNRLDLELDKNLAPSVVLFNNAFFCTENPEKIRHVAGNSENTKEGYHHNNSRTKFDKLFDKPLGKNTLDKINGLVTLSMLGNKELSWPRFPHTFDICDLINCHPITAGSDTLWLHTRFEQLKIYSNPERTEKLFNFLLDYSNDVIDSLLKIHPNVDEPILGDIKNSYERLLSGLTRNFNSYNLKRELSESEITKINQLKDKVEDFNINHPNQTIDSNLMNSLTEYSFKQQGETLTRIVEKRIQKFETIKNKEIENKEFIANQINAAIEQVNTVNDNDDNIFKKLDAISYELYKGESSGKVVQISNFIHTIRINSHLADIHKCSYFNIPSEHQPNYNYYHSFVKDTGNTRKNFYKKKDEISEINPELSSHYADADTLIVDFLKQLHTQEGQANIIENGGLISSVEKLCRTLDPHINAIRESNVKKYDSLKESTPFNDIEHRNLGSYWELQVEKASKYDNFDGMVAIIHEYLHRIEDKYRDGQVVSGKSLADLPKKIIILKDMGSHHQHISDAIETLISRYNYLGELFDEQNKDRKKYKPKKYRIN